MQKSGRLPEAEQLYRRALELREKLAADFPAVPTYQSVLARYESDGSLDPGFGREGLVLSNLFSIRAEGYGLALQPDGQIVAVGRAVAWDMSFFAVARYNPDGSLDETFGFRGVVLTPLEPGGAPSGGRGGHSVPDSLTPAPAPLVPPATGSVGQQYAGVGEQLLKGRKVTELLFTAWDRDFSERGELSVLDAFSGPLTAAPWA